MVVKSTSNVTAEIASTTKFSHFPNGIAERRNVSRDASQNDKEFLPIRPGVDSVIGIIVLMKRRFARTTKNSEMLIFMGVSTAEYRRNF